MNDSKVFPFCYGVLYTWHGEKMKSIFLSRDRAELYVTNLRLTDARIVKCYDEDSIVFVEPEPAPVPEPQIKRVSNVVLESTEVNGMIEIVNSTELTVRG